MLFPILLVLIQCSNNGFFELSIKPGQPKVIDNITNSHIIISLFQSDPYSMKAEYYDSNYQNDTFKFTTKGTYIFKCVKIIFTSFDKEQKLALWQIPNDFCNYSIILHAENQLDATTDNEHQQFPLCIFTQFNGNHFFLSFSISSDSKTSAFFYSKDINKPSTCTSKFNCNYRSIHPFFVRITSLKPDPDFKMTLSYRVVINSAQKDNICQVLSLPTVTKKGLSLLPTFVGDSSIVCTNIAQGKMSPLVSLIITILLTVTVLFLIHCIGAINVFHICQFEGQVGDFSRYYKSGIKDDPGPLLE